MNKTISILIKRVMLPLSLFIYSFSFAQQPAAQIMIGNDTLLDAKTYQFDVFVSAKDANGTKSFNLKGLQGGFQNNLKSVRANGVTTVTVITDNSDFKSNPAQAPTTAFLKPSVKNPMFIQLNPAALQTNGMKINKADKDSRAGWTKVCTIKLTNSVAFSQETMNVIFSNSKTYPTVLLANYKKARPSNGSIPFYAINMIYNPTLNLPLTKFNVIGTASTIGDGSISVGLNGSELKCAYKLVLNGVVQDASEQIGTGEAIYWNNLPAGNYSVVARRIATYLKDSPMTGNVVVPDMNDNKNGKFITYPNPVSNQLTIESLENNGVNYFDVYNSIGQIVYKGSMNGKTVINTSTYAPGVYLIRIENGKTTEFKKIVKQ